MINPIKMRCIFKTLVSILKQNKLKHEKVTSNAFKIAYIIKLLQSEHYLASNYEASLNKVEY